MTVGEGGRAFYRIVVSNPPTRADFVSDQARGKRAPTDPAKTYLHDGLSVYATLAQARRKAIGLGMVLGEFVAELRIPDGRAIRIERTIRSSPGHHTLWGAPEDLLDCVVAVVAVHEGKDAVDGIRTLG